jgi:hypothetical protein
MTADANIVVEKQNYFVCAMCYQYDMKPFVHSYEYVNIQRFRFILFRWVACNFQISQKCIPDLPSILMSFESSFHFVKKVRC